ncbi:MAG TPA: N-acetyltransferase [Methanocorpusculum sp.]|nr:N-acetyltransferase [Methanocorpusculum sp.]
MEHILIRPFTSKDYPGVCVLDAPMFANMGGYVLFRHIQELFGELFFVAEDTVTGRIAGYILGGIHLGSPDVGKLIRIGVAPEYQRKECGTNLCNALFSAMQQRGVKKVHLTVAESNTAAVSFYKKNGFVQTDFVPDYFYPDIARLIFEKEL